MFLQGFAELDVLAGWALGYLYYLACVLTVRPAAEIPAAPGTAN